MKNTKRPTTAVSAARRSSANSANPNTKATSSPTLTCRPTTTTGAAPKHKAPTLATAARSVRTTNANTPTASTKQRTPPKRTSPPLPTATTKRLSASQGNTPKPRTSIVHDAVRRAFHAAVSPIDPLREVTECEHLRGELVRIMADHQRQADEIVALRALARSLKEEVEAMQDAAVAARDTEETHTKRYGRAPTGHEFFQLDAHVDALREENAQLRDRVEIVEREKRELEEVLDREIPRCELLAVQARAELESTASQLRDEQQENDRLRSEIAYYKARSRSPVRARQATTTVKHEHVPAEDDVHDKENEHTRSNIGIPRNQVPPTVFDESLRESLMSSVASLSMSAASAFSSQLQDDVETLKTELRRLHRSIDVSMMSAARGGGAPRHSDGHRQRSQPRTERVENVEEEEEENTI